MRAYITATVEPEIAEALEREAKQKQMQLSPLVREILTAHTHQQNERSAQRPSEVK
jgi:hypothetical protein